MNAQRPARLPLVAARWLTAAALAAVTLLPTPAEGEQAPLATRTAADCKISCGVVLGLSSFTLATGSVVTWSRITGGLSSRSQGQAIWIVSFGAALAGGVTVYGPRRERTVYASGIGAVAGALVGVTVQSLAGSSERSSKVAAALVGAAVGIVAGGVYGAYSYESPAGEAALMASRRTPLLGIRIPF